MQDSGFGLRAVPHAQASPRLHHKSGRPLSGPLVGPNPAVTVGAASVLDDPARKRRKTHKACSVERKSIVRVERHPADSAVIGHILRNSLDGGEPGDRPATTGRAGRTTM